MFFYIQAELAVLCMWSSMSWWVGHTVKNLEGEEKEDVNGRMSGYKKKRGERKRKMNPFSLPPFSAHDRLRLANYPLWSGRQTLINHRSHKKHTTRACTARTLMRSPSHKHNGTQMTILQCIYMRIRDVNVQHYCHPTYILRSALV